MLAFNALVVLFFAHTFALAPVAVTLDQVWEASSVLMEPQVAISGSSPNRVLIVNIMIDQGHTVLSAAADNGNSCDSQGSSTTGTWSRVYTYSCVIDTTASTAIDVETSGGLKNITIYEFMGLTGEQEGSTDPTRFSISSGDPISLTLETNEGLAIAIVSNPAANFELPFAASGFTLSNQVWAVNQPPTTLQSTNMMMVDTEVIIAYWERDVAPTTTTSTTTTVSTTTSTTTTVSTTTSTTASTTPSTTPSTTASTTESTTPSTTPSTTVSTTPSTTVSPTVSTTDSTSTLVNTTAPTTSTTAPTTTSGTTTSASQNTTISSGQVASDTFYPGDLTLLPGCKMITYASITTVVVGNINIGSNVDLEIEGFSNGRRRTLQNVTIVSAAQVTGQYAGISAQAADACQTASVQPGQPQYSPTTISVAVDVRGTPCGDEDGLSTGAIVGIAIGAVIGGILLVLLVFVLSARQRRRMNQRYQMELHQQEMTKLEESTF